ncbi:hypothetical protein CU103_14390 [Phyllobacterium sophorae]|uniref:Uncharacterized protein n=1 Tax=Phyllobacterium sophorae TaxID=1520277 RepID=A0A2P7BAK3_9HYPH|nr:hypothetical protein CU103_14390 [Phyllobacterium sophorae]
MALQDTAFLGERLEVRERQRRAAADAELVIALAAGDAVAAAAAIDGKAGCAGGAIDDIRARRADELLDGGEAVARRIAAAADAAAEHEMDRRGAGGIIRRVDAGAAVENIGARAASENVVAAHALQMIVAAKPGEDIGEIVAGDGIGKVRADDIFEVSERVALGRAASAAVCVGVVAEGKGDA